MAEAAAAVGVVAPEWWVAGAAGSAKLRWTRRPKEKAGHSGAETREQWETMMLNGGRRMERPGRCARGTKEAGRGKGRGREV